MQHKLERIGLVSDLLAMGVRQKLLDELVPASGKISALLGGIVGESKGLFVGPKKSAFSAGGWIKYKEGSLVANELFRMYSTMFDYHEILSSPIKADKLVRLSFAFNVKYGHVINVDINRVYSLFVAINNRDIFVGKCCCGTQYLRVVDKSNGICPWCRVGVERLSKTKKPCKSFKTIDAHSREKPVRRMA